MKRFTKVGAVFALALMTGAVSLPAQAFPGGGGGHGGGGGGFHGGGWG
ncbi:hypothetical protein JK193_12300, partial [Gluconobacter wancherniae]|nr:hypothetical protein [Gluconobacter wancherniae]MBS1095415.1 hypothetical protein [Gluconobacter wancherniae]